MGRISTGAGSNVLLHDPAAIMNILIVEDNKADQVIMKEAFKEACIQCDLSIVNDGVEAIDFLNREGKFLGSAKVDIILLDLNLPKKNGREVLVEIKKKPKLKHIPILVFSNSESPQDICQCYDLGVNAYINKPSNFQEVVNLVNIIETFWLKLVRYCPH
jgi:chemotaxis family two-component system response regulator Rcp1